MIAAQPKTPQALPVLPALPPVALPSLGTIVDTSVPTRLQNSVQESLTAVHQNAQGDTGQSRIVANFLLAWWSARAAST